MNTAPVLVVMAAGMGSRYGGLKQIDPVGLSGEVIMDFSIYDALQAGFKKVIFIIKEEMKVDFCERIGKQVQDRIEVEYIFQRLHDLPDGYIAAEGRIKPWGTGHAVMCAAPAVRGPFAVINADDFYGRETFRTMYEFLAHTAQNEKYSFAMAGYGIENTLSESGYVSRGVCQTDGQGNLTGITERVHIEKREQDIAYTEDGGKNWTTIPEGTPVSMNFWGFSIAMMEELKKRFVPFLDQALKENPQKAEYFLPAVVDALLREEKANVKVLRTSDKWYGVTNREDKEPVSSAIQHLQKKGVYPKNLWQSFEKA